MEIASLEVESDLFSSICDTCQSVRESFRQWLMLFLEMRHRSRRGV